MKNEIVPNTKFLRLSTGEDIIAGIVDVGTEYLLQSPMKVVYIPIRQEGRKGYMSVSLMQWIMPKVCGEGLLTIGKNHIVLTAEVDPEMMTSYEQAIDAFKKINEESQNLLETPRMSNLEEDDILQQATDEEINLANKMLSATLGKKPGGHTVN